MRTQTKFIIVFLFTLIGLGFGVAYDAKAESKCVFTRDLELGDEGEDVRCLQQFLNSAGFNIAESGAGSPGKETNQFKEKTQAALRVWQTSRGVSGTGYFGPVSRAEYEKVAAPAPVITPPVAPVVAPVVDSREVLAKEIERKVRNLIKEARDAVEQSEEDVEEAEDDGENIAVSTRLLERAKEKLLDALYAFLDEDYEEAMTLAVRVSDYADDASSEVNAGEDEALEAIEDADDAIEDAEDEIDEADDDGEDVDDAEETLDEARDTLDEAQEAFDDGEYDEAIELANEAEELAQEAIDEIGN